VRTFSVGALPVKISRALVANFSKGIALAAG